MTHVETLGLTCWLLSLVLMCCCYSYGCSSSPGLRGAAERGAAALCSAEGAEKHVSSCSSREEKENMAMPASAARLCRLAGRSVASLTARHRRAVSLPERRCYTATSTRNSEWMFGREMVVLVCEGAAQRSVSHRGGGNIQQVYSNFQDVCIQNIQGDYKIWCLNSIYLSSSLCKCRYRWNVYFWFDWGVLFSCLLHILHVILNFE